jgi:hypothetical protein
MAKVTADGFAEETISDPGAKPVGEGEPIVIRRAVFAGGEIPDHWTGASTEGGEEPEAPAEEPPAEEPEE